MIMKESEINNIYENLEKKIEAECKRMENKIPYWTEDGIYQQDYAEKDIYWWTNGFWSGILWQLYHAKGAVSEYSQKK